MTLNDMMKKTGKRQASFALMLEHLNKFDNPYIVETGCARQEDNFDGDGMSTLIFDGYVAQNGGKFWSVDINPLNTGFARSQTTHANIITSDSVKFLNEHTKYWVDEGKPIHLLYLDSFDFDMKDPHPSSMHHLMELTAVMPALKSGYTMIVVDDNFLVTNDKGKTSFELGKGAYVKQFMDLIGKPRVFTGYQWVWIL